MGGAFERAHSILLRTEIFEISLLDLNLKIEK